MELAENSQRDARSPRQVFCPLERDQPCLQGSALLPEVFTTSEIARAAGVSTAEVRAVLDESNITPIRGRFLTQDQAVEAVTLLKARASGRAARAAPVCSRPRDGAPRRHARARVGGRPRGPPRRGPAPRDAGGPHRARRTEAASICPGWCSWQRPVRAAEVAEAGCASPIRPPAAELKGRSKLASPVAVTKVAKREPAERVETPPPPPRPPDPKPEPTPPPPPPPAPPAPAPPVVAPVVSAPADAHDRAGVPVQAPTAGASNGPGTVVARAPEPAPARGRETARVSATGRSRAQVAGRTARARGSRRRRSCAK